MLCRRLMASRAGATIGEQGTRAQSLGLTVSELALGFGGAGWPDGVRGLLGSGHVAQT